ncbi:MAG: hypothetical protein EA362_09970 [Saprospirales bacterium]|nr:MAG: hypothetical protein EA362_09970 [Saprospirales bacterium]
MRNLTLYCFTFCLLFVSCKKTDGDLIHLSDSFPVYSSSVVEKVWETQLDSVKHVFSSQITEGVIFIHSIDFLNAVSAESGELLWTADFTSNSLFLSSDFTVNYYNGKIYFASNNHCSNKIVILDKKTGELIETLSLSEIPGVEGSCSHFYMIEDQIFFSTHRPNGSWSDRYNFSFFLYQYDISSNSLDLLYSDDLVIRKLDNTIHTVLNHEETHLYFSYSTGSFDDQNLIIVEVPVVGGSAEKVLFFPLGSSRLQRGPFVIKNKVLIAMFKRANPYFIEAYDLNDSGKLIWSRGHASFPETRLPIFIHLDELYVKGVGGSSNLRNMSLYNGLTSWSRSFRFGNNLSQTLDNLPIAVMTSSRSMGVVDLITGSVLTVHDIIEISGIEGDVFRGLEVPEKEGNRVILITLRGKVICLELPF